MKICELFSGIQGESTHAGRRCFFLRLTGCNLRCSYCDTAYAWEGGRDLSISELVAAARNSGLGLVEITGGEPLLQSETPALCRALLAAGQEVLLETNGSLSIAEVPSEVRKILDCKLPDSGMSARNRYENYALLQAHDEVKFVVSSRADFDFGAAVIEKYALPDKTPNLIFSPVWGKVDFEELADWVLHCGLPVRMQLQLHKIIYGDRRGV